MREFNVWLLARDRRYRRTILLSERRYWDIVVSTDPHGTSTVAEPPVEVE
jgi:hypothetical protein